MFNPNLPAKRRVEIQTGDLLMRSCPLRPTFGRCLLAGLFQASRQLWAFCTSSLFAHAEMAASLGA